MSVKTGAAKAAARPEPAAAARFLTPAARSWLASPWPIVLGFVAVECLVILFGIDSWRRDRQQVLARLCAEKGEVDESIRHYQFVQKRAPQSNAINYELGKVYFRAGRLDEAIACFEAVLRRTESPPADLFSLLGRSFLKKGEEEQGFECFKKAYQTDPQDSVACYYIGEYVYQRGDLKNAAHFLERAVADREFGKQARARLVEIESRVLGGGAATAPSRPATAPAA